MKNKSFWAKMFAEGTSDTISSKRVTMFVAMVMLVILSVASAFGYNCSESYIITFASLVGAQSGMTTLEKCAKSINKTKIEIARYENEGVPDDEDEDCEDE